MNTTYGVLNNSSLIIDTDKLRENVRTILRSLPAGTKLIPVVKDDAYGMGMVGVARTLSAFPEIGCFAVANVSEGVTLRREGIRQDILIMGSTLPFQYAPAVECDLTVTVSRLGMVPELAEVCKAQSKPLNVQIKLETGMHRIGVEPGEELAALIGELKAAQEWVHVTGAFSHFAWPGNAEVCEAQYKKLLAGAEQLKAAGIPVPMCYISASESSELFPQYALDAADRGENVLHLGAVPVPVLPPVDQPFRQRRLPGRDAVERLRAAEDVQDRPVAELRKQCVGLLELRESRVVHVVVVLERHVSAGRNLHPADQFLEIDVYVDYDDVLLHSGFSCF